MELKRIDHIVIVTSNLDKCLDFYVGILGMEHKVVDGQHTLAFGNAKINLHLRPGEFEPYAKKAASGAGDFCLIAEGDIYEIKHELEEKGAIIAIGVVQRNGALGHMDSIYMYDPDGDLVEIAVYRKQDATA